MSFNRIRNLKISKTYTIYVSRKLSRKMLGEEYATQFSEEIVEIRVRRDAHI